MHTISLFINLHRILYDILSGFAMFLYGFCTVRDKTTLYKGYIKGLYTHGKILYGLYGIFSLSLYELENSMNIVF